MENVIPKVTTPRSVWLVQDVISIKIKTKTRIQTIDLSLTEKSNYCFIENYSLNEYPSKAKKFIQDILINAEKASSVKELAKICNYNEKTFKRYFSQFIGELPSKWLKQRKEKAVIHSLRNTKYSIKELATMLGFCNASSLSHFCKKNIGSTPSQIRKEHAAANCPFSK